MNIDGEIYDVVQYWSYHDYNQIPKIISSIINKNDSYLFFSIFADNILNVQISYVVESFRKYNMLDVFNIFWRSIFKKNYTECSGLDCCLTFPWITIPLIMNDKYWIQKILTLCDTSPYTLHNSPFGMEGMIYHCRNHCALVSLLIIDFIKTRYPEFIPIVDSLKSKTIKYKDAWYVRLIK
jgi:hypothetical protein